MKNNTTTRRRQVNFSKVADRMDAVFMGTSRTVGTRIERTIRELLEQAEERGGVYTNENVPVSDQMDVIDLLQWHCDYKWELAE